MKIGCHVSIAGGIWNAPKNAADLGCEVFQMFTRSPQGGPAPKIDAEVIKKFKQEMEKWKQQDCYIHAPYYINFASAKEAIRKALVRVIREELERGSLIGAKCVMTHLGSSKDMPRDEALKLVASGVRGVMDGYTGTTEFLLEISAGAGNVIGDTFEELEYIIKNSGGRVGVCLDTAHMFASGYDIKTKEGFDSTTKVLKESIGLEKVKVIHANDSMVGLNERKDRHDHIGDGKIGKGGFESMMKVFPKVDFVLETKHDKIKKDILMLKTVFNGF
ncbi:MAG: deoxyribonuclease IV [Candidatus Yanofskybacteria bacterium]|nr:deoxyribonuclease IV [Candidatus Yanofskybacteria bacterium]